MTEYRIAHTGTCYQVMWSHDGRYETAIGPRCRTHAEAAYFFDLYAAAPRVSPLRASGEGSTGGSAVALTAEPSPDVRSTSPLPGGKG